MSSLIIAQTLRHNFSSVARPAKRTAIQSLRRVQQTAVATVESAKTVVETISNSSNPILSLLDADENIDIEGIIDDDEDIEPLLEALDRAEKGEISHPNT
jgi:hypothetical protein